MMEQRAKEQGKYLSDMPRNRNNMMDGDGSCGGMGSGGARQQYYYAKLKDIFYLPKGAGITVPFSSLTYQFFYPISLM